MRRLMAARSSTSIDWAAASFGAWNPFWFLISGDLGWQTNTKKMKSQKVEVLNYPRAQSQGCLLPRRFGRQTEPSPPHFCSQECTKLRTLIPFFFSTFATQNYRHPRQRVRRSSGSVRTRLWGGGDSGEGGGGGSYPPSGHLPGQTPRSDLNENGSACWAEPSSLFFNIIPCKRDGGHGWKGG